MLGVSRGPTLAKPWLIKQQSSKLLIENANERELWALCILRFKLHYML